MGRQENEKLKLENQDKDTKIQQLEQKNRDLEKKLKEREEELANTEADIHGWLMTKAQQYTCQKLETKAENKTVLKRSMDTVESSNDGNFTKKKKSVELVSND